MLIIPKEFGAYVKGHPNPQLVSIKCCEDCDWIVHANPYRDKVILDRMWPALAASLDLKVGDYLLFKVTADGFKPTIYDRITSCQRRCNIPTYRTRGRGRFKIYKLHSSFLKG
jgi:hypothetical protein